MSRLHLIALFGIAGTLLRGLTALIRDTTVHRGLQFKGAFTGLRIVSVDNKALFVKHLKTDKYSAKPSTAPKLQSAAVALGQDR